MGRNGPAPLNPPVPKPLFEVGKSIIAEPSERDDGPSDDVPQIDVLLRGNRLQITADVDAAGAANPQRADRQVRRDSKTARTKEMKEAAN
jgi:hypothetical protein